MNLCSLRGKVKHYGDTAAVVCSLLILGYIWRVTSPVFSVLVVLQHNVTSPVDNGESGA